MNINLRNASPAYRGQWLIALAAALLAGLITGITFIKPIQAETGSVSLTVYNQDLALVQEHRTLTLKKGINEIRFTDVAALIDPTSVHFASLTDPAGTRVLEQNYEYDVVGSEKLLQKYVDQEIDLVTEDGTAYHGTLLSGTDDIILQGKEGGVNVVRRDTIREFRFPALPEGLITRPTLVWLLDAEKAGEHETEVSYLTNGLSWQADYVALLAADETSLDLDGWISLNNSSGATYTEAKLKLLAGDIHRAPPEAEAVMKLAPAAVGGGGPPVEERALFEYHVYEVQRPVTVKDNQTKQIEFVAAAGVPARKFYVFESGGDYYGGEGQARVNVKLEFKNEEKAGLGVPLPRGRVRVYKADVDGSQIFIGEDRINHTPKDEPIRLYVGDAFDLVGERKQTNYVELGDRAREESYEITLRNHKEEDVEIHVVEHLWAWAEWEITEESAEHTKLDSHTVEWVIPVPANGEAKVTYTVRYRW